ncbi:MAG: winged helix DNA-binding domain-containing protein [Acidobacteriia bacterium]|nr:winged helix DNA-binding domain-containing protein [Terriglobia bacterium]
MSSADDAKLRAWWSHKQGLDGRLAGATASSVLARTGWARSVAGAGPYLTLFSRAGIGREAADAAVRNLDIHELPSARGCTYVVPASDFALALKAGQNFGDEMKLAAKLGVSEREIAKLCDAVVAALAKSPLEPSELRDTLGPAVRNLGEEGKRKGLTTTLPVALGRLQAEGEIRRVPTNGRLDQQRYRYAVWRPNPLSEFKLSTEEANTELARRHFAWIGPAILAEFQWFSGLGVKAARAAIEPLKLEPLAKGDERLLMPDDRDAWEDFRIPKEPQYALVSSLDGLFLLRRDVKGLLDGADLARKVPVEKGKAELGGISDLYSHAIVDRGRLAGLWEFDTATESIVWVSFVAKNAALKKTVERTQEYVCNELGDARSFSLDSPKSREPRVAALRAMAQK